jgi:hypothetical protein
MKAAIMLKEQSQPYYHPEVSPPQEMKNSPNPNQQCPKQRHSPVNTISILRRPAINKQPSRNERRAPDQRRQSILRLPFSTILRRQRFQNSVRTVAQRCKTDEISNPKTDVRQTHSRLTKTIRFLENKRERREQQVQNPVNDGHVQRHQGADRREEHQLRRPRYRADEDFFRGDLLLEFGAQVWVAGFFAQAFGLLFEEHGRVGFVDGEERDGGYYCDGDGEDPEDPAPAGCC